MEEALQQLKEEGFTPRMLTLLAPKLTEVMALSAEDRGLMRSRMAEILSKEERTQTRPAPKTREWNEDAYTVFGNTMAELLRQNNESLLEEMDLRISQRIMKELNYLFRERESLEEERYRKLDRTIREYQSARQQTAVEEERRHPRKYGLWRG